MVNKTLTMSFSSIIIGYALKELYTFYREKKYGLNARRGTTSKYQLYEEYRESLS